MMLPSECVLDMEDCVGGLLMIDRALELDNYSHTEAGAPWGLHGNEGGMRLGEERLLDLFASVPS